MARGIINGNSDDEYKLITVNDTEIYNEYVKKVAIINLKKIAGGKYCGDKKSLSTLHFSEHAKIFQNELREQIRDIKPTIVVCCGKDVYDCVKRYNLVEDMSIVVDGYHPRARVNTDKYYKETIAKSKKIKEENNHGSNNK